MVAKTLSIFFLLPLFTFCSTKNNTSNAYYSSQSQKPLVVKEVYKLDRPLHEHYFVVGENSMLLFGEQVAPGKLKIQFYDSKQEKFLKKFEVLTTNAETTGIQLVENDFLVVSVDQAQEIASFQAFSQIDGAPTAQTAISNFYYRSGQVFKNTFLKVVNKLFLVEPKGNQSKVHRLNYILDSGHIKSLTTSDQMNFECDGDRGGFHVSKDWITLVTGYPGSVSLFTKDFSKVAAKVMVDGWNLFDAASYDNYIVAGKMFRESKYPSLVGRLSISELLKSPYRSKKEFERLDLPENMTFETMAQNEEFVLMSVYKKPERQSAFILFDLKNQNILSRYESKETLGYFPAKGGIAFSGSFYVWLTNDQESRLLRINYPH